MAEYIIANGQTLSNQNFGYDDTILVQAGGTLSDSVISKDVVSVTLDIPVKKIISHRLPSDWNEQRKFLGLPEKDYTAK